MNSMQKKMDNMKNRHDEKIADLQQEMDNMKKRHDEKIADMEHPLKRMCAAFMKRAKVNAVAKEVVKFAFRRHITKFPEYANFITILFQLRDKRETMEFDKVEKQSMCRLQEEKVHEKNLFDWITIANRDANDFAHPNPDDPENYSYWSSMSPADMYALDILDSLKGIFGVDPTWSPA